MNISKSLTAPEEIKVWDPLVRIFHWSLVAAFAIALPPFWLTPGGCRKETLFYSLEPPGRQGRQEIKSLNRMIITLAFLASWR